MVSSPQASFPHLLPCPPHFSFEYPESCWTPDHPPTSGPSVWPHPVSLWWSHYALPLQWVSSVALLCLPSQLRTPSAPLHGLPSSNLTLPPSRPCCSGAGGSGCTQRDTWLMDTLPSGRARCIPERGGARKAWEQCTVGASTGCCLRLPTPATWPPLPAAGGQPGSHCWGSRGPRAWTQRHPGESRAALARHVDSAP